MSHTVQWTEFVDTAARTEHERLALLAHIFDPFSIENLDRIGIRPGWRCLEVGAEHVVATDISTRLLGSLSELGVTVLRHDITADDAPGEFDLIHSRFCLEHLPGRDQALARMVSWLRPGGWLLLEAGTTLPEQSTRPVVGKTMAAANAVLAQRLGTHSTWARTMPLPLRAAGLVNCTAIGQAIPALGGGPMSRWLADTYRLVDEATLAGGTVSRAELDETYATYADPSFVDYTWLTVAAVGRKPAA